MIDLHVIAIDAERQNWAEVIARIKALHLKRYGQRMTDYKLGKSVGLDHSQIEWLEKTPKAEPRHYAGSRLLLLLAVYETWDASHTPPQMRMQTA